MTLETVDISDVVNKDFAEWYKLAVDQYYSPEEAKLSFDAGNPTASRSELKNLLSQTVDMDHELVLFNPMLDTEIAASHIQNRHKQILIDLFSEIKSASTDELREKYQELSEDDEFVVFLSYLQDSLFEGDINWDYDYENTASTFLLEAYLISIKSTKDEKSVLKNFFPETHGFITSLTNNKIIEPYLFWTISDGAQDYFNRCAFDICHDSRVLAVTGNLTDPAMMESGLIYPSEFKPLAEVDQDFVYNIESGQFALTNKLIETSDLIKIGFEVGAGMGDGYYPTIPFFDHLGELQMVTTFFTHMMDSEWLDSRLVASNPPLLHSHHVPLEMGYLDCDGSFFFGDSTWFHNGPGDDLIIEFSDLPVDKYLVVRFIDVNEGNRTWAVSVMRDKAKRNFEILFKVFPELTNRNDDF